MSTMLQVFYGNNAVAVRQKAFAFVRTKEDEGFTLERIDTDSYVVGMCADIAQSVSLFGNKTVYLIDTPSSDELFYDEVTQFLQAFKDSSNVYVVVEGSLLAAQKKVFAKYAESLEEIRVDTVTPFNAFSLADSLSSKDKKTLWLQLQDAKQAGLSAEEIIGTLWWQLKTLRLASKTQNAEEAGMKDYPYSKAKRALRNFTDGELQTLSSKLLTVYHDGHLGKGDIDLALERFTLTI